MTFSISWIDIPCINVDRAIDFYSHVFSLKAKWQPGAEGRSAVLFNPQSGNAVATLFHNPNIKPSQQGILNYIEVTEIDKVQERVKKRQGQVSIAAHSLDSYGTRAVIIDSEGNRLALVER